MVEVAKRANSNFFATFLPAVNSPPVPHRDISAGPTSYRPYNDEYASIQRRTEQPTQVQPMPDPKKEKKWSIGKLFRRKKKEDDTASSSESDEGVSTKSPSKRKAKKKKRVPPVNNFDHIVIRDTRRAQSLAKPNIRDVTDDGVLSDPSAGFINYRAKQELYKASKESLSLRDDVSTRRTNIETPSRRTRKGRLKARVEALRNSMRGDSSSDEESLKSSNSSSMVRFRSDDSLMRSRDSSLNKRSRSARNERYIKRLSRDEENQLNKEAELLQQGYTKAEVEMLTRTPTSQSSGYGTCKREQPTSIQQEQIYANDPNRRPMKSESISSFPSTQSYPSSINFNAKINNDHINYSIKYNNINKEPLYANNNRERSIAHQYESPEKVMCVKLPLGNVTNIKRDEKAPPVPPPRDMQRKVATPISMYYENNPIVADRMSGSQNIVQGVPNNDFDRVIRRSQERSMSYGMNGLRRPISNSEDHIAMQNNEYLQAFHYKNEQPRRPASVSAEPNHYGLYANTPPWRKKYDHSSIVKPEPVQLRQDFLYFADQSPRSRRPISIKPSQNGFDSQYLSDSQTSLTEKVHRRPKNASEFWKKIDDAERQKRQQNIFANSRSNSDFTNNSSVLQRPSAYLENSKNQNRIDNDIQNRNKINFGSKSVDTTDGAKMWKATTEYKRSLTVEPPETVISPTTKTHARHKSDTFIPNTYQMPSDDEKSSERRKSTNLDDALNELEAIYNSLGLGDEDLLDRAERRELMTPRFNDHFNDWNGNDDDVQLRSQPTTPLRRVPRRSTLPDKLQDDMAFRRMNSLPKDKPNYKEAQAQISYMLASPVYVPYASDDDAHSLRNEPDIVHDDVVYRNITQTKNRLKTLDPEPPFGIPRGPVSPAPASDYLHATPENKIRSRFVPRRSPDLVSDDLAYRSLRKDHRNSALFNGEDYNGHMNNNHNYTEFPFTKDSPSNIKKKRAVRSLSANIFTMIQKEIDDALNMSKMATIQKTQSNSDVMKRLRETFEKNDNDQEPHYPRNKVKPRHNTVNIFVNNSHAPNYHFAKDDSFIHNDDKYLGKPPSCDKSKSSSPSNRSPQPSKRSSKDEFQQVLSMLAQEAMDTSNKLGVALAELDKNRNNNEKKSDVLTRISDSRQNFLNGLTGNPADEPLEQIKHVNVHSEVVSEPKTDSSVKNACDEQSKAQKTEDSLLAISDQLHKVEDQLKHSFEKEVNFDDESLRLSTYIAKAEEELKAKESTAPVDNKIIPDVVPTHVHNDSMKIENTSNVENNVVKPTLIEPILPKYNSLNPFLDNDDKVKEINEINAFRELKEGISDLIAGITQVNEKLFVSKSPKPESNNISSSKITGITEASEKLSQVQNDNKQQVPFRASVNLSIYEDDLEIKKENADSTEYNSSEELATIFKMDGPVKRPTGSAENEPVAPVRDDLSSPKLVKSMNQQLRRLSVDQTDDNPSQSSLPNNVIPWRNRQNHNSHKESRECSVSAGLALACSSALLETADLDWLAILGLLLAFATILAMLIL